MEAQVVHPALQGAQTEAQGAEVETEAAVGVVVAAVLREERASSRERIRKQRR